MLKLLKHLSRKNAIYDRGIPFAIIAAVVSLLIHLVSFKQVHRIPQDYALTPKKGLMDKRAIKIKIVEKPKAKEKRTLPKKQEDTLSEHKGIIEAPQEKTQKPKEDSYLGAVDHIAKEQTKTRLNPNVPKGMDPGVVAGPANKKTMAQKMPKTKVSDKVDKSKESEKSDKNQKEVLAKIKTPKLGIGSGEVGIYQQNGQKGAKGKKARNAYENLLNNSFDQMNDQVSAGYQDYIDEDFKIGNRIDINTSEYRYIGYFTSMRKAIELVWNYPIEAAERGLQGKVGLEFVINHDGSAAKIRVLRSSGYQILDKAIVEAISLASPFSPLPKGFGTKPLVVTGSFHYQLNAYAH